MPPTLLLVFCYAACGQTNLSFCQVLLLNGFHQQLAVEFGQFVHTFRDNRNSAVPSERSFNFWGCSFFFRFFLFFFQLGFLLDGLQFYCNAGFLKLWWNKFLMSKSLSIFCLTSKTSVNSLRYSNRYKK